MAFINKAMGEQMLDLCHAAKVANRMADTIAKGFGFGDTVSKLFKQLVATDIVMLRALHMVGHHSMDVSTVMAEFYKDFRVGQEGPSMTLLPTMMPVGILDTAFRFVKDTSYATTNQNTEHMTWDTGQTTVGGLPTKSVISNVKAL